MSFIAYLKVKASRHCYLKHQTSVLRPYLEYESTPAWPLLSIGPQMREASSGIPVLLDLDLGDKECTRFQQSSGQSGASPLCSSLRELAGEVIMDSVKGR